VTTLFWISRSPTTVIPASPFFYNFRFAIRLVSNPLSSASGGRYAIPSFFFHQLTSGKQRGSTKPLFSPFSLLPFYHLAARIHARWLCRGIGILSTSRHSTCAPQQCECGAVGCKSAQTISSVRRTFSQHGAMFFGAHTSCLDVASNRPNE
jgi:hypothetical protein